MQSTVRSYVAGAGEWSKARRDAAFLLYRYGQSADPQYLRRFEQAMLKPAGNREARVEMQKPDFDPAVATRGLIAAGQHPSDIASLIWFFRCCNQLPRTRVLVDLWSRGDDFVLELQRLADRLKAEIESPLPSQIAIQETLTRVETIDEGVDSLEEAFIDTLAASATTSAFSVTTPPSGTTRNS